MRARVIVNNHTIYRTRDLIKFCRAGLKHLGINTLRVVNFKPLRKVDGTGAAGLGEYGEKIDGKLHEGVYIRIRLPTPNKLDLGYVARVFEHEVLHTIAIGHNRMTYAQRTCRGPVPRWTKGLKLRIVS